MNDFLPRPELAPPGVWSFPTPTRARLDNGLETVVFQLPGQHVVSAHLVLDIPLNAEDRDREGVATICARVLDEGSRQHDGEEFAELLETEGAGFGVEIALAGLQAILDVPVSHLDPALSLFAEAVTEPALAERDVNRHVQLRLAEIEQAQANSAQAASIAFRSAVFDPESRASRMNGGEPETVAQVTQDHVAAFHADHFGPARATLIMAGDFRDDPVAAGRAVPGFAGRTRHSRPWPQQATRAHIPPLAAGRPARRGAGRHPLRGVRHRPARPALVRRSPWPATRWAGRSCPG